MSSLTGTENTSVDYFIVVVRRNSGMHSLLNKIVSGGVPFSWTYSNKTEVDDVRTCVKISGTHSKIFTKMFRKIVLSTLRSK
jgi:hypothetical protein